MWFFRRKPAQSGFQAELKRLQRIEQGAVEQATKNIDPKVFDLPLTAYLAPWFADERQAPLLVTDVLERICDQAVQRAHETHDCDIISGFVEAACKAASLALLLLLRRAGLLASAGQRPSNPGVQRALSVMAVRFVDMQLQASQVDTASGLSRREFAGLVGSMIDPFGSSFAGWLWDRRDESNREGGRPIEPFWLLLALHVALWAPEVEAIPADSGEATALLPERPQALGDVGSWYAAEATVTNVAVVDFAPRLKRLLHNRPPKTRNAQDFP